MNTIGLHNIMVIHDLDHHSNLSRISRSAIYDENEMRVARADSVYPVLPPVQY